MLKTIKGKIVVYFTVAFAVVIIAFLSVFYIMNYRAQREQVLSGSRDNLEYFQSNINRVLERCENLSDNIYFNRNIAKVLVREYELPGGPNLDRDLSAAIEDISTYLEYDIISEYATCIIVHGNNGKTIRYGTDADYFAISPLEEQAWFDENKNNSEVRFLPAIRSVSPFTKSMQYIPLLRREISLDSHKTIGWQMIGVSTSLIRDALADYNFREEDLLLVYDSSGQCLYCSREGLSEEEYTQILAETRNAEGPGRINYVNYSGSRWLPVRNVSGYSGLTMVHLIDYRSFRREFASLGRTVISLLIVMMVGALLMTLVLSNVLTEPILRIIQATTRISGGDFSPDPALESDDEIGSMGKSINSLAANMAEMVVRVREEERNKKELEYRILQNQINPHFVYNVLNSIKVMAQLQGADNICKLIDSFGGLLKEVSKGVNDRVTVREEFDLAEKFVFIHKLRRKGLIESSYVIEPGCEDCLVIKFLLQPLLENAIIHGFEGKHGMGELIIEAHKAGQNLELSILDNGIGMTQEEIDALLEGKTGKTGGYNSIGVQNVQERIRMMYGEEYGIHYSSVKGEYTRVMVLVPLEYAEETVEVQDHV